MAIRGKVVVFTTPDSKKVILAVRNEGDQALGVTNNYFPDQGTAKIARVHDDTTYGHGLECLPGKDAWSFQEFPVGGSYNGHPIKVGGFLRVGLRGAAFGVAQIPQAGQAVEMDLVKDFEWYQGTPDSSAHHTAQIARMKGWHRASMQKNIGGGNSTIQGLLGVLSAQKSGVILQGNAKITAHPGPGNTLSHWTVRFENGGDTAFIGTVVFKDAKKNDGIGLESMGVPNKGSAAEQRIEANGNYGIPAKAGLTIRLGVRGWGFKELELPAGGEVEVPLNTFTVDSSQVNKKFFEHKEVLKKQQEKLNKVQFFEGGKPINDEIKPITYRGAEAIANSPFDPPELQIRGVPDSKDTPGGGWVIEMKSKMPNNDDDGPVGFVATLKLGPTGVDPLQLPPKKFPTGGSASSWFLPRGAQLGELTAQEGVELQVGTRGTGWHASIPLPKESQSIDSTKNQELWGWRPDQYTRDQLSPDFTSQCRLGPDSE